MENLRKKAIGNKFLSPGCGHSWDITWRVMILHGHEQCLCHHAAHPPMHDRFPSRTCIDTEIISSTKKDENLLST